MTLSRLSKTSEKDVTIEEDSALDAALPNSSRVKEDKRKDVNSLTALRILLIKNFLLKKKAWIGTLAEFLVPIAFIVVFSALKQITNVVNVRDGWSSINDRYCPYPDYPDAFNLSCRYPYTEFMSRPRPLVSFVNRMNGSQRLCLAVSSSAEREKNELSNFVSWMEEFVYSEYSKNISGQTYIVGNGMVDEFEDYIRSTEYREPFSLEQPQCLATIVFDSIDFSRAQFEYTLRFSTEPEFFKAPTTRPAANLFRRGIYWYNGESIVSYIVHGFITLQTLINSWIISNSGGEDSGFSGSQFFNQEGNTGISYDDRDVFLPGTQTYFSFPVKSFKWDEFFEYVEGIFSLAFVLCFLYPVARLTAGLVEEKETRMLEMQRMLGVKRSLIALSWFTTYTIYFFLLSLIVTAMANSMLPSTAAVSGGFPWILFITFFLFGLCTIAFGYCFSHFFQKKRTASYVVVTLYFIGYFFYYLIPKGTRPSPLLMIIPQVAFAMILESVVTLESEGSGVSFATITSPIENFAISYGVAMLAADILVWSLAGLYLSEVLPDEFGRKSPFYYFCLPSFWKKRLPSVLCGWFQPKQLETCTIEEMGSPENVEPVGIGLRSQLQTGQGIQIRNVSKIFHTSGRDKVAVDNLNLDIYEGQILALLGHNGAGKTTLMSCLSGMLPISKGKATIMGYDIIDDLDEIRRYLGFCPQHDILYPQLTVKEHLWFYGSLRGLYGKTLSLAIKDTINEVGLEEKSNSRSRTLSGGQKRRLSLANAIIGGSRILFVDEPTSGVDPHSRRNIWRILQNLRKGRTTILTTHFMDEADFLGDRVAILANGELKCCGSVLFLKERYGCGYTLTLLKKQRNIDVQKVLETIHVYYPNALINGDIGSELKILIPEIAEAKFTALFSELEKNLDGLGLEQFRIENTTMETIFLSVIGQSSSEIPEAHMDLTSEIPEAILDLKLENSSCENISVSDETQEKEEPEANFQTQSESSMPLFLVHLGALFLKRLHFARRDIRAFVFVVFMPIVLYLVGMLILFFTPLEANQSKMRLETKDFNPGFPSDANAFLPIVEWDFATLSNTSRRRVSRVSKALYFPDYSLEVPGDISTSYPVNETEIWGRVYEDGQVGQEDCAVVECKQIDSLTGSTLLQMAEKMINDNVDRGGASLYSAAILQPRNLSESFCYNIRLENQNSLGIEAISCLNTLSDCAYIELNTSALSLPTELDMSCFPVGCWEDFIEFYQMDNLENLIAQNLLGSLELTRQLLGSSKIVTCSQELCNEYQGTLPSPYKCRSELCRDRNPSVWNIEKLERRYDFLKDDSNSCPSNSNLESLENDQHHGGGLSSELSLSREDVRSLQSKTNFRYSFTALLNTSARHESATLTSNVHSALLSSKLAEYFPGYFEELMNMGTSERDFPRILTNTHPFPWTASYKAVFTRLLNFIVAIFVMIAFAFIPAGVASYIVMEREHSHDIKHQQLVSGVSLWSYWLSIYLFDMLVYLVPFTASIIITAAFKVESFTENGAFPVVVALFFGYGLEVIPFAYLLSNLFRDHTTALILTLFISLATGLVLMIASFVMDIFDNPKVNEANAVAKNFYKIFPGFCLGDSLLQLSIAKEYRSTLGLFAPEISPLDWDVAGGNLLFLYVGAGVYILLVVAVEIWKANPWIYRKLIPKVDSKGKPAFVNDEDVTAEANRIAAGDTDSDLVVFKNFRKVYRLAGGGRKIAVHNLSFGVPPGECFGLLGVNGAGKSTTFKFVAGQILPTSGTAQLDGKDIMYNQRKVRQMIGYCPQFDALLPLLNVREHLQLFGRIKGFQGDRLERLIQYLMKKLTLKDFELTLARSLSGGNKRKLSLAIAIVGFPKIVFADEPSTGMDPVSRRCMWDIIMSLCRGELTGTPVTFILTTHNMEECEALCNRLSIMVNGQIRCIGSPQHLKKRFTQDLLVNIKICIPSTSDIDTFVKGHELPDKITPENILNVAQTLGKPDRGEALLATDNDSHGVAAVFQTQQFMELVEFIEWWISEDWFEKVNQFVADNFEIYDLVDHLGNIVKYRIEENSLGRIYKLFEESQAFLPISQFEASQPNLETVFNIFASGQINSEKESEPQE